MAGKLSNYSNQAYCIVTQHAVTCILRRNALRYLLTSNAHRDALAAVSPTSSRMQW